MPRTAGSWFMSEAHVFAEGAWGIVFANEKALGKAKKNAVPPGSRKVLQKGNLPAVANCFNLMRPLVPLFATAGRFATGGSILS